MFPDVRKKIVLQELTSIINLIKICTVNAQITCALDLNINILEEKGQETIKQLGLTANSTTPTHKESVIDLILTFNIKVLKYAVKPSPYPHK